MPTGRGRVVLLMALPVPTCAAKKRDPRRADNTGVVPERGGQEPGASCRLAVGPDVYFLSQIADEQVPGLGSAAPDNYNFRIQYIYQVGQGDAKIVPHLPEDLSREIVARFSRLKNIERR